MITPPVTVQEVVLVVMAVYAAGYVGIVFFDVPERVVSWIEPEPILAEPDDWRTERQTTLDDWRDE